MTRMKKVMNVLGSISLLFLLVLLGSCTSKDVVLTETKPLVIKPPASMYDCPTIQTWPRVPGMTDKDVANLLVKLYKNNETCKHSLDAIRSYLDEAERQASSKK